MNPKSQHCYNILVVDDKVEDIIAIEHILKPIHQANIIRAGSGKECFSEAINHDIALILLDVQMPVLDGFATAKLLKSNEKTKYVPIIFVTALNRDQEYIDQSYESGATDYILKPINEKILLSKVKVFIDFYLEKLKTEEYHRKYKAILESAGEGICGLDQNGIIQFSNPAAENMLGAVSGELEGKSFLYAWNNVSCSDLEKRWLQHPIAKACKENKIYHTDKEYFINHKIGSFPVEYTVTPINDKSGNYTGTVVVFADITRRKNLEGKLTQMSLYDPLTGLINRNYFYLNLNRAIDQSKRSKIPVTLLFIDIDNFKSINDVYGHAVGDKVLSATSTRLCQSLRKNDLVARLGDDEFTVILDSIKNQEDALLICNRIIESISKEIRIQSTQINLTASIGIATFPDSAEDATKLVQNADTAMYFAKKSGKNSVQYFNNAMHKHISKRFLLENNLHKSIDNNELNLHFQPEVELKTNIIKGFEVLLRWNHPILGLLSPQQFISIAEETGIIFDLTIWVIMETNRQIMEWRKNNYPIKNLKFSINISPYVIGTNSLTNSFFDLAAKYNNKPEQFDLEITESALFKNLSRAEQALNLLSDAGATISIDDFGTGYSSLYQLKRLPVHNLKIDKSFISDVFIGSNDAKLVNAILRLASELNLTVVAEGIETIKQLNYLRSKDCQLGQGYYYSPPVPSEEVKKFFASDLIIKKKI